MKLFILCHFCLGDWCGKCRC